MADWTTTQKLLVAIPALPLIATALTAVFGPRLLREKSHLPIIVALLGSCLLSFSLVREVGRAAADAKTIGYATTVDLWTWADVPSAAAGAGGETVSTDGAFRIAVTLRADGLTSMMLAMVTFVGSLIAIYAGGYMRGDRGYWRFFAYIGLFVFSMTMLVSVSNFVLLYVFWEAVGLCSYLLIGFWYEKPEAAAAGKKAFLVNRVGDFGFALALFLIWTTYGTLNFHDVGSVAGVLGQAKLSAVDTAYVGGGAGFAICMLLLVGACGKSAQFPLHVWLPDAMEGPTPVSALIHAATMVTAGVYMIARCTPLFAVDCSPYIDPQLVVACVGGLTAILAGAIAMTQNDLKRVLAYSTISQLGYMFLSLGTGSVVGIVAGMFHLFTHAFFKALLFLGAGSVMHAMGGVIDMRRFGGLRRLMPFTFWTFLVGAVALAGLPWIGAGFYSKDAILAAVYEMGQGDGPSAPLYRWLAFAAFFTAFLTAFYTFRAFWMTFYGKTEIPAEAGHHAHESPPSMTVPLVVLAICTLAVGWVFGQPNNTETGFAGLIASAPSLAVFAEQATDTHAAAAANHDGHGSIHQVVMTASIVLVVLGLGISAFLYHGDRSEVDALSRLPVIKQLGALSRGKFFFDPLYTLLVVWPCLAAARIAFAFDRWFVDGLVNAVGRLPSAAGGLFRTMQNGIIQLYAVLMLLGILTLLGSAVWQMW